MPYGCHICANIVDMSPSSELPTISPDRQGYVLNGDRFTGFADREDLDIAARTQLARFAERYAPVGLSDKQRALLATRAQVGASDLLRALAQDEADIDAAFSEGLYDLLSEQEIENARSQPYPLSIGAVAGITGASKRQIRHWEQEGLLRSYPVGGQRRYLRGGVLRAVMLAKQDQHVIATLRKAVSDPRQLIKLMALAISSSSDQERIQEAISEFTAAGQALRKHLPRTFPKQALAMSKASAKRSLSTGTAMPKRAQTRTRAVAKRSVSTGTRIPKGPRSGTRSKQVAPRASRPKVLEVTVYVSPSSDGWDVMLGDSSAVKTSLKTQVQAIEIGREIARERSGTLIVHRRDGAVKAREIYPPS